ncbi:hypothetical protein A2U01_0087800, partial [Trifolium medium]|nr:hypothetical protein [Trifolium medium]
MKVPSKYRSREIVECFRKAVMLSGNDDESAFITEPVEEGEFVTRVNTSEPH